jgi:hypothetical protein
MRHLLVAIARAAGDLDSSHMLTLQVIIEKSEGVGAFDGVFDWLTGIPPPLTALVTAVKASGYLGPWPSTTPL